MDDIIATFIDNKFTPEYAEELNQSLGLFVVFNYFEPVSQINDLLMMESYNDPDAMNDAFTNSVSLGLDYLLDRHALVFNEQATIPFKNIALRGMYQLLTLDDPTPVIRVLESNHGNEIKICEILEHVTSIPSTSFIQVLDEVRPICLKLLGDYMYSKEGNSLKAVQEIAAIRDNLRAYEAVFGINEAVRSILDADVIMGEDFEMYIPLYTDLREQVTDEKVLIDTLFFLLMYSNDGVQDPMGVYSAVSETLVSDLNMAARLGRVIGEMMGRLTAYKEHMDEQS